MGKGIAEAMGRDVAITITRGTRIMPGLLLDVIPTAD